MPILACEGCGLGPTTRDMLFVRAGEREKEKRRERTQHKISKDILKNEDH